MENVRQQVVKLRRALTSLNDATGGARSRSADVQMAACFRSLMEIQRAVGVDEREDTGLRFARTYCSSCGQSFGPGCAGYSHCDDHAGRSAVAA